ncbi:MAG: porin family protein [Bacteroidales bacterium]
MNLHIYKRQSFSCFYVFFRVGFIFFFTIFLFLSSLSVQGKKNILLLQKDRKIHFGLEFGSNFMFINSGHSPWILEKQAAQWGISGGGFFEFDISKRWYARIELLAHARRMNLLGIASDTNIGNLKIEHKFTQISVPLEIGFQCLPLDIPVKLSVFLGLSPNFLQSSNAQNCTIGNQNSNFHFADISLGIQGGICLEYSIVSILARYEYMTTNSFKITDYSFNHNGLSLLLRFKIF